MKNQAEKKKNPIVLIGVVAAVSVLGTLMVIAGGSVRIGDIFSALKDTNPRLMGFMALPFIVVAAVIARYWFSKREERMWKEAIRKTRSARDTEPGRKDPGSD